METGIRVNTTMDRHVNKIQFSMRKKRNERDAEKKGSERRR